MNNYKFLIVAACLTAHIFASVPPVEAQQKTYKTHHHRIDHKRHKAFHPNLKRRTTDRTLPPVRPPISRCIVPQSLSGYTRIYSVADLSLVRNNIGGNFVLCNNLDLSSISSFSPIASSLSAESGFRGHFDGNGYKVLNLTIDAPYEHNIGFFGRIFHSGKITNLTIENPKISGDEYVGPVTGDNWGTIENCHITGTGTVSARTNISSPRPSGNVGGIAGGNSGFIRHASVGEEIVISGFDDVGGIAGYMAPAFDIFLPPSEQFLHDAAIEDSSNAALVRGSNGTGGIVGSAYTFGVSQLPLINSGLFRVNNSGVIKGELRTGGIIGFAYSFTIEDGKSTGDIEGRLATGGLVGSLIGGSRPAFVRRSFYQGYISGYSEVGGLFGNTSQVLLPYATQDNFADAIVSGSFSCGGLVGIGDSTVLVTTYSSSFKGNSACQDSGGIIGKGSLPLINTYFDKEKFPEDTVRNPVAAKTTAEMKKVVTFENWDISPSTDTRQTIWKIAPNGSEYPKLRGR